MTTRRTPLRPATRATRRPRALEPVLEASVAHTMTDPATEPTPDQRRRCLEEAAHQLLGAAHHGLRTPLTSIVGFTEVLLLEEAGPLTSEQAHMLRRVAANGERMLGLVEEMLADAAAQLV